MTFIDREVRALRKEGVQLQILSIRRPWTPLSPEQKKLQDGIIYMLPVNWLAFSYGPTCAGCSGGRGRTSAPSSHLITRRHPSLKDRGMTVLHFFEGVYAAHLLRRRGL